MSDYEEEKMGKFPKYEIECAAKTLMEAEEIKKDKAKMAEVSKILKKKISSIEDLKKLANGSPDEDED